MSKIVLWIIGLALLGGIGWVGWKWYTAQQISVDAYSLIPRDAIYAITTNDPIDAWNEISASGTWSHLKKNQYFAAITASANSLDSLIHENDLLFDLIGSRALIASAHMTGPEKYDFLFLADLEQVAGIKFVNEYLTTFTAAGLEFKKESYRDSDVFTLYDPEKRSSLYVSLPGSYLLASYTKNLVTRALDSQQDTVTTNMSFIRSETGFENGLLRLYVNYEMLPRFLACYTTGKNEYVNRLSQALQSTSLSVTLDMDFLKATGQTFVNDSVESYIKTLATSGMGGSGYLDITPKRAAFVLALGFSSFRNFFENFQKNIQQDVTGYNEYEANLKQVEDYLDISLQKNFINWIGDEVALIEMQSSGSGTDNETAIVLRANDINKAKDDLAHIEKMVRRKTPVKFKAVDYKGYQINYLSMKGLFKVLLGKFFARYDKPYFTVIGDFVIFSNHPQTLKSMIDDYESGSTMSGSEEFQAFRREFYDQGAAFVYVNTPVLFNTIKKLTDASTRTSFETNKDYIVCFRQLGFQLVPEQGGFKTMLGEQFVEPVTSRVFAQEAVVADSLQGDDETPIEVFSEADSSEDDPMKLPYIYVQNLNASSYTGYYPDSLIHYKVDVKNGFKDGLFTEYYPDGEVKMRGHFKNDRRDGIWRLFNESGKVIIRRNYQGDEVTKEKIREE